MAKDHEIQFEVERDFATRFVAEKYRSNGYGRHFHRNVEIYGVLDGEVNVIIAGDKHTLKNGQIAIVNCMEVHEYDIGDGAEIFYFHIGTSYLSLFISSYSHSLLPRWLLDTDYNKKLYEEISTLFNNSKDLSELKKHGIATCLIADIIEHYGVLEGGYDSKSHEIIEAVIQYIYEHYSEDITLASLANEFYIDPKLLSKKLSNCLGIDLRLFVSDIRLQKALQMMEDPNMRGVPKKEIIRNCGFKRTETYYTTLKRYRELYNNEKF